MPLAESPEVAEQIERLAKLSADVKQIKDLNLERAASDLMALQGELRGLREGMALSRANTPAGGDYKRYLAAGEPRLEGKEIGQTKQWQPGLLDDKERPVDEWHAEFRRLIEARTICRLALPMAHGQSVAPTPMIDAQLEQHVKSAPKALERIFSGGSGLGSDWQQTLALPILAEALRQPVDPVEALFSVIEIGSASVTLPYLSTVPRAYRYGAPSTDDPSHFRASTGGTTSRTLTTSGWAVHIPVFDDAAEDAVIATMDMLRQSAINGLRYSRIDAIVNGDTDGSDTFSGWNPRSAFDTSGVFGGEDDIRKSFVGLRGTAFDVSATRDANADTTWSTQTLGAARAALAAPHGVIGELVYLASPEHYIADIMGDSNLLTFDKFGPAGALISGEIARASGVSIIPTEWITADLAASGRYTGSGALTGGLLLNRRSFVRGVRKGMSMEPQREASKGLTRLIFKSRETFKAMHGTAKTVHFSYNIAV